MSRLGPNLRALPAKVVSGDWKREQNTAVSSIGTRPVSRECAQPAGPRGCDVDDPGLVAVRSL